VEVAVHLNGQTATSFFTAMRKEVADSNLYECQPPLFPLRPSPTSSEKRGGCLSIKMNSHLFSTSYHLFLHCRHPILPAAATSPRVHPEKEVAVHQNGQTAMRKEVADSNLYECQPPLFTSYLFLQTKWSGTKWGGGCTSDGQTATSFLMAALVTTVMSSRGGNHYYCRSHQIFLSHAC
jgi:hypothetical protein